MEDQHESNIKTYYQGRYYDDLIGAINDFAIPTSQTRNKVKKAEFRNMVIEMLDSHYQPSWPYKQHLTIAVGISGLQPYINRIDIDNVLKNLMDILKGRVFVDDKQIFSIMAEKEVNVAHAFFVAVRVLKSHERNLCIPKFYSSKKEFGIENGRTTYWRAIEMSDNENIKNAETP